MPNSHFGFSESPFKNNLDQRFLFLTDDHQEVLAAILYFIETEKGLAMLCGDVGTGKTMLVNSLISRLSPMVKLIILSNPDMNAHDLLYYLAKTLGIKTSGKENFLELTDDVKIALMEARRQDKQLVLAIDEAHLLSDRTLEEVLLLSNIETSEQKLLQILLVGEYELSHKLNRPEMRQLRQRINVNRFLPPLTYTETINYIDYRLQQVGSRFGEVFEDGCKKLIFEFSRGCPRRINQLCEIALMVAATEGQPRVAPKVLKIAEEALQTDRMFASEVPKQRKTAALFEKSRRFWAPLTTAIIIALLGMVAWDLKLRSGKLQPVPERQQLSSVTSSEAQASPNLSGITARPESSSQVIPSTGQLQVTSEPPEVLHQNPKPGGPTGTEALPQVKPPDPNQQEVMGPVSFVLDQTDAPAPVNPQPADLKADASGPAISQPAELAFKKVIPQKGDNLSRVSAQQYPEDQRLGAVAIILQNPWITDEDRIVAGKALILPKINFKNRTIQLKNNLFYSLYSRFAAKASLRKRVSWLKRKKVKFVVRNSKYGRGVVNHRIFLGGYDTWEDLRTARASLITKKR